MAGRRTAARLVLSLAALVAVALPTLVQPASVAAEYVEGSAPAPLLQAGPTDLTLTNTGPGHRVDGFIADASNPFNPANDPYPPSNPTTGWTEKDESFAGVILGTPAGGPNDSLKLYCIDIRTPTGISYDYSLGTWDTANVPRAGYVARILNDYYPNTQEPSSLTDASDKGAAVQAAVWFFSDRYVLDTNDRLRSAVVAIVADVKTKGPVVQPPPPTLNISPPTVMGLAGSVLGPFTVTSTTPTVTVSAVGGTMYSDAAGTVQILDGATVNSGSLIYVRSAVSGASSVTLLARAVATVPDRERLSVYRRCQFRAEAHPCSNRDADDNGERHCSVPGSGVADCQ